MILPDSMPSIFTAEVCVLQDAAIQSRKGSTPEDSIRVLRDYIRERYECELERLPFPYYLEVLRWANSEGSSSISGASR